MTVSPKKGVMGMSGYMRNLLRLSVGVRRFLMTEAMYGIGIGMYSLVLNLHLLSKGMKEDEIGLLMSIGILIMGALAIPVSISANRIGRKKLLVSGIMFIAAGSALYAIGNHSGIFYLAQTLVSIGLTLVETTEVQLLFHYCASRKEEASAFSLMFAVFTAFTGAGTLAAGYLPNSADSGDGYGLTLLLAALVFVVHSMIRGLWLPSEGRESETVRTSEVLEVNREVSSLRKKLPSGTIWLFSVFMALLGGAIAITGSFLNVIVKYRLNWMDDKVSILLAVSGVVLFAASLMTPYVLERFGHNVAIVSVFLVNILVFASLSWAMPVWMFTIVFLVRGGGLTMLSNLLDSQLMSAFKERERNLYAGMRSVFRSLGSSGAALLTGWILIGQDYETPFFLTSVVLLLCLVYYIWFIRPILDRRLKE